MSTSRLTRLETRIMEALWDRGALSVREIVDFFPEKERPAFTTIQTTVYRLEKKEALRRTKRVGNANIFEATISRSKAHRRIIDELLGLFGGRAQPLMSHFIESGQLTLEDVEEARKALRRNKK
jgi:BlaI family transcriptional regulator, penicillinase repressor